MKNIFKLMCSTLAALCLGVFTSCDLLGDLNPDFKFKEEYEVLMGKWTCETYLEGEPYTLQFTFNKNGKVKVREVFEGDDFSTDMLFNIEGDLSEGADVSIYGGQDMDGESVELNFIVTVNGDEAEFEGWLPGSEGVLLVFKRG